MRPSGVRSAWAMSFVDLAQALHQELRIRVEHPVQSGGEPVEIIIRAAQVRREARSPFV